MDSAEVDSNSFQFSNNVDNVQSPVVIEMSTPGLKDIRLTTTTTTTGATSTGSTARPGDGGDSSEIADILVDLLNLQEPAKPAAGQLPADNLVDVNLEDHDELVPDFEQEVLADLTIETMEDLMMLLKLLEPSVTPPSVQQPITKTEIIQSKDPDYIYEVELIQSGLRIRNQVYCLDPDLILDRLRFCSGSGFPKDPILV